MNMIEPNFTAIFRIETVDGVTRWKRMFGTDSRYAYHAAEAATNKLLNQAPYKFLGKEVPPGFNPDSDKHLKYINITTGEEFFVHIKDKYTGNDVDGSNIGGFVKRMTLISQVADDGRKFEDIDFSEGGIDKRGTIDEGSWLTENDVTEAGVYPLAHRVMSFIEKHLRVECVKRDKQIETEKNQLLQKRQERIDALKKMRAEGDVDKTTICKVMVCDDVDPLVDAFLEKYGLEIIEELQKLNGDPDPIKTFKDTFKIYRRAWFVVSCGKPIVARVRAAALVYITMKIIGYSFTQHEVARFFNCTTVGIRKHVATIKSLIV